MKKKIPIRIEPCEMQCNEDIAPYKILLGSILNQAIIDALGYKHYKKRYETMMRDPDKYSWVLKDSAKRDYSDSTSARRFIFGEGLKRFIKEWKMDIDIKYFKDTYKELESEYIGTNAKGERNAVCKRILSQGIGK